MRKEGRRGRGVWRVLWEKGPVGTAGARSREPVGGMGRAISDDSGSLGAGRWNNRKGAQDECPHPLQTGFVRKGMNPDTSSQHTTLYL